MKDTKSHSVMQCYKADARIAELEADNAKMRAALEMVEWVDVEGSQTGDMYCPLCKEWIWEGHEDDCLIGLALARQAVGPQIAQAALAPAPAESEVKNDS
jgi:hypothetical protein